MPIMLAIFCKNNNKKYDDKNVDNSNSNDSGNDNENNNDDNDSNGDDNYNNDYSGWLISVTKHNNDDDGDL